MVTAELSALFNRLVKSPRSEGQSGSNFMCSMGGEGGGEGKAEFKCSALRGRLEKNFGCHGNKTLPLTCNREKDASTLGAFTFDPSASN